jgi:hypothetical protein
MVSCEEWAGWSNLTNLGVEPSYPGHEDSCCPINPPYVRLLASPTTTTILLLFFYINILTNQNLYIRTHLDILNNPDQPDVRSVHQSPAALIHLQIRRRPFCASLIHGAVDPAFPAAVCAATIHPLTHILSFLTQFWLTVLMFSNCE